MSPRQTADAADPRGAVDGIVRRIDELRHKLNDLRPVLPSAAAEDRDLLKKRCYVLREMADLLERGLRTAGVISPSDETGFIADLRWLCEHADTEDELALLRQVRQSPPYSSRDAVELLARAEQQTRQRLGLATGEQEQPLPDAVQRMANIYIVARLGDALMAERSGTAVTDRGARVWRVKVRLKTTDEVRGELIIGEDGRPVQWHRLGAQ